MAAAPNQEMQWKLGFINSDKKYLTAEKFQFKLNANGGSLRRAQTWWLEKVSSDSVALKSCYGRYLGSDKDGKVTADSDSIGDDNKFQMITQDDGRVAIKSVAHGRYFGGTGDNLSGYSTTVSESNMWTIQLAIMPQLNLRNVNRKTYAHLSTVDDEIQVNEDIPWGFDATITIEFYNGRYAIRAANARDLHRDGYLMDDVSQDTLYRLVFRGTQVAFLDNTGKYLTAVGPKATLRSRKDTISKDELFSIEDTNPQVTLIATNRKYVSTRTGNEVRANQEDVTDKEIFQLEAVDRSDMSGNVKWAVKTKARKYWNSASKLAVDKEDYSSPECQFLIEWQGPMVSFRASNGKYLSVTSNGTLAPTSAEISDSCKFVLEIVNHPIICFKSEYGFVGVKGASQILECNRSQYDVFRLEGSAGTYKFKAATGKYWATSGDTVSVSESDGTEFFIEFRAHTRMCIIAPNGQYIKGTQNGRFAADGSTTIGTSTLWEY